jgi:hypothetical protein
LLTFFGEAKKVSGSGAAPRIGIGIEKSAKEKARHPVWLLPIQHPAKN